MVAHLFLKQTLIDESLETGTTRFPISPGSTAGEQATLQNTAMALSDMVRKQLGTEWIDVVVDPTPAGFRERRLLVKAHDPTTGEKFNFSIPGFNDAIARLPNSDRLDPAGAAYISFQNAFQAIVQNHVSGQLLELDSIWMTRGAK